MDRSVAAAAGWLGTGTVLLLGDEVAVGEADEPGDAVFDALGASVPVLLTDGGRVPVLLTEGELVMLGDEPVDADGDGVIDDDGVSDSLRVVDGDTEGLGVIDGDGVPDAEEPGDALSVFDAVLLGLCDGNAVTLGDADIVGVCDADWTHVPKLVRPHTHVSVSGII